MSGSDVSSWAVIDGKQYPSEYAVQLSRILGCGDRPGEGMINCLRSKEPMELVYAAEKVSLRVRKPSNYIFHCKRMAERSACLTNTLP